jgi:hypothetical protein
VAYSFHPVNFRKATLTALFTAAGTNGAQFTGGWVEVYPDTIARPLDPSVAPVGTPLITLGNGVPAVLWTFTDATIDGTSSLVYEAKMTNSNNVGTASWFRLYSRDGAALVDGSVGVTGSGADMILSTLSFTSGSVVRITSLSFTHGMINNTLGVAVSSALGAAVVNLWTQAPGNLGFGVTPKFRAWTGNSQVISTDTIITDGATYGGAVFNLLLAEDTGWSLAAPTFTTEPIVPTNVSISTTAVASGTIGVCRFIHPTNTALYVQVSNPGGVVKGVGTTAGLPIVVSGAGTSGAANVTVGGVVNAALTFGL